MTDVSSLASNSSIPVLSALLLGLMAAVGPCTIATNGDEGIAKAKAEKPDLILLDMMMPVKDGFLTAKALKGESSIAKIPVLALTSFNQQLGEPFELEVDAYLQKTIAPAQLIEKVQVHLKRLGF